ncbi:MAG: hypothetical protein LC644_04930 [Pseudonocardia sp.]|nr:hypothetical protein [Pseudonocardia sp.]
MSLTEIGKSTLLATMALADVEAGRGQCSLLADALRSRVTAAITDPVLAGFWSWYDQLTDAQRAQVIAPLMNKPRAFLLRPAFAELVLAI